MKKGRVEKKGISPLIATVLIIGFTVVLAVLVINWALPFVRNLQETTEESSNTQILCAQDVIFSIKTACDAGTNQVKLTVSNDGVKDIDSFIGRFFETEDKVQQDKALFGSGLKSFDISSHTKTGLNHDATEEVELIPVVTIGGKSVTCSTNVRSFGEIGTDLKACS
jgi:flagellin-like protein|tara:strand:+ start:37727 stop:38227 length:501 start_codon:yes stop_codon:yes gene_type:complete